MAQKVNIKTSTNVILTTIMAKKEAISSLHCASSEETI